MEGRGSRGERGPNGKLPAGGKFRRRSAGWVWSQGQGRPHLPVFRGRRFPSRQEEAAQDFCNRYLHVGGGKSAGAVRSLMVVGIVMMIAGGIRFVMGVVRVDELDEFEQRMRGGGQPEQDCARDQHVFGEPHGPDESANSPCRANISFSVLANFGSLLLGPVAASALFLPLLPAFHALV